MRKADLLPQHRPASCRCLKAGLQDSCHHAMAGGMPGLHNTMRPPQMPRCRQGHIAADCALNPHPMHVSLLHAEEYARLHEERTGEQVGVWLVCRRKVIGEGGLWVGAQAASHQSLVLLPHAQLRPHSFLCPEHYSTICSPCPVQTPAGPQEHHGGGRQHGEVARGF